MPAGEIYLPLAADFADNPKVRALMRYGREARPARDLFVQMLCYCKRTMSDGYVPDEQIGLLVYPDPEKAGKRDAQRLADVGLIERGAGGWFMPGWLERNPSKAAVAEKSAAKARGARLANHRRWHKKTPDPDCEWCNGDQISDQTTDPPTDPNSDQTGISGLVDAATRSESTESESESESESETKSIKERSKPFGQQADRPPECGSDDDPGFAAFWDAYPRKVGKGQARKAWRTAVRTRKADPKVLVTAAERYRDDPHRRASAAEFTAHPATWLNGERWSDHPEPPARAAGQDAWWRD